MHNVLQRSCVELQIVNSVSGIDASVMRTMDYPLVDFKLEQEKNAKSLSSSGDTHFANLSG